jgi:hypothetical protein
MLQALPARLDVSQSEPRRSASMPLKSRRRLSDLDLSFGYLPSSTLAAIT